MDFLWVSLVFILVIRMITAAVDWKANRAKKFTGRGSRSSDFSQGFRKGKKQTSEHIFSNILNKSPLENTSEQSDDRVPLLPTTVPFLVFLLILLGFRSFS